jgi:hypothetical protein
MWRVFWRMIEPGLTFYFDFQCCFKDRLLGNSNIHWVSTSKRVRGWEGFEERII